MDQRAAKSTRQVWLLGGLRLQATQGSLRLPSGNVQRLFAFLVLNPDRPHPREVLADRFWPEAPPERVRHRFSDLLYRLRQGLGSGWLLVEEERVGLRRGPDLWVDVWAFERLSAARDPVSLQRAVELYAGELLPELYDDWILPRRVALHEKYLTCLLRLGQMAEEHRQPELAYEHYQRLVEADPLREEAYRGLMRSLADAGRLVEALDVYAGLTKLLQEELAILPGADTRALAQRLQGELDQRRRAPPPFVGRAAERAQLLARLDQGRGGLVVVLGEAGIGKTRLLQELDRAAAWRGWQVAWGHSQAFALPPPHTPLRQALDAALPEPRLHQLARLLQPLWLTALASLVPRIGKVLDQLEQRQPALDQNLLPLALRHTLDGLQQIAPHLLILEDLQWADPALWPLLDQLRPALADMALLLVLSGRDEDLRAQPSAWSLLEGWDRAGETIISLKGLSPDELAELARTHGRAELTPAERARLSAASGGNCLLALTLLEAGGLEEAPPSLHQAVARLLTKASEQAQGTLQAASVLGHRFPYPLWEAVAEEGEELVTRAGELERASLIVLEADSYRFAHDTLRAHVYQHMPPERRRRLHRRALEALQRYAPQRTLDLLHHAEQAGDKAAVARYAHQAGQQALAAWTLPAAVDYFSQALDAMPPEDLSGRYVALLGRERALDVLGDREPQRQDLSRLSQLADRLGDVRRQATVLQRRADFAWGTGEQEGAQTLAERGLALARQAGDGILEANLLETLAKVARNQGDYYRAQEWVSLAHARFRQAGERFGEASTLDKLANLNFEFGDYQKATQQHRQAADIFRELGAIIHEARTLNGLGLALRKSGGYARARETHHQALAIARETSDRHGEWVQLANLGGIAFELGDYVTAVERYAEALGICRQIDSPRGISMMLNNLGFSHRGAGELTQALAYFDEALEVNRSKGYQRGEGYTQKGRGLTLLDAARHAQAREAFQAARSIWEDLNDRSNQVETVTGLALAHLSVGDLAQAGQDLDQALADLDEGEDQAPLRQWVHYVAHRVRQAEGQSAESQAHLRQAQAAMLQVADSLPPDLRRRLLEQAPLNRRTQDALDALARRVQVRLVRAEVPLGRELTEADYVPVTWTLYALEDDEVSNKTERRRQVLRRLLAEAQAQGGAPTDDDLADALGVSRRTILRDMEALAQAGLSVSTRGRNS